MSHSRGSTGVDMYINTKTEPSMDTVTDYGWEIMKYFLDHNNTLPLNGTELPVVGSFVFLSDPGTSLNVSGGEESSSDEVTCFLSLHLRILYVSMYRLYTYRFLYIAVSFEDLCELDDYREPCENGGHCYYSEDNNLRCR